jgi:hypothetical protein
LAAVLGKISNHPPQLLIVPAQVPGQVADRRLLAAACPVSVDRPHGHLVAAVGLALTQHPKSHRLAQGQQVLHLFGIEVLAARARRTTGLFVLGQHHAVAFIPALVADPGGPDGHLDELYLTFIEL